MESSYRNRNRLRDEIDRTRKETISIGNRFQKETQRYVGGFHTTASLDNEIFPNGAAEILSLIAFKARNTPDGIIALSYREIEERVGVKRRRQLSAIKKLLALGIITRESDHRFTRKRIFKYHNDRYVAVRNAYIMDEPVRKAAKEANEPRNMEDWKRLARAKRRSGDLAGPQLENSRMEEALNVIALLSEHVAELRNEVHEMRAKTGTFAPEMYTSKEKGAKTEESTEMYKCTDHMYICTDDTYKCPSIINTINNREVKQKEEGPLFFAKKEKDQDSKRLHAALNNVRIPAAAPAAPELPAHLQKLKDENKENILDVVGYDLTGCEDIMMKSVRQGMTSADMRVLIDEKLMQRGQKAANHIEAIAKEAKLEPQEISYQLQIETAAKKSLYYTMIDTVVSALVNEGIPTITLRDLEGYHPFYNLPGSDETSMSMGANSYLAVAFDKWIQNHSDTVDPAESMLTSKTLAYKVFSGQITLGDALVGLMVWRENSTRAPNYADKTATDAARFRGFHYGLSELDVIARDGFFSRWGQVKPKDLLRINKETLLPATNHRGKPSYTTNIAFKGGLPLLVAEFLHATEGIEFRNEDVQHLIDLSFARIPFMIKNEFNDMIFDIWFGPEGEALPFVEESFAKERVSSVFGELAQVDQYQFKKEREEDWGSDSDIWD